MNSEKRREINLTDYKPDHFLTSWTMASTHDPIPHLRTSEELSSDDEDYLPLIEEDDPDDYEIEGDISYHSDHLSSNEV